jgi:LacI family transcriptional regulator
VALVSAGWTAWQQRLLSGALRFADAHPRILIRVFAPFEDVAETARSVVEWQADGAFGLLEDTELSAYLAALPQPVPFVNCSLAREAPNVVTVLGDFSAFARTAIEHLRHLGLRSIALLALEEGRLVRQRQVQPFLQIAQPRHPSKATLVFAGPRKLLWSPEARVTIVPRRIAEWLRALPKPVGILCPQLGGGGYLIRCCHALGFRVPEDVAVVGSDDTDVSLASNPTLTSVLLSLDTVGFEAVRLLMDMIAGKPLPKSPVRLGSADLHVRESTGRRRPEICDIAGALSCIEENACRGITVHEVIRRTQRVSKVTFHLRFLEAVGRTPAETIRERRLREVRRLLADTTVPLAMVSELCGFRSPKVLARLFRDTEHTTLSAFRKRHQPATVVPRRSSRRPHRAARR